MTPGHPLPARRCALCGVDEERLSVDDALDTIRTLGRRYREAVAGVPPAALAEHPDGGPSMLDVVVHVRETLELLGAALDVALDTHHARMPDVAAGTSDASAVDPRDVGRELDALDDAASGLASRGRRTSTLAWERTFDVDGATRPVMWIVQHAAHEGAHHLRDLARIRREVAPSDDD